jgi:hypothetical protein
MLRKNPGSLCGVWVRLVNILEAFEHFNPYIPQLLPGTLLR